MEVIEKEEIKRAQELANSVKTTKEAIRQAIADKDVDIPADTAFADYPSKIEGIYPDALFLRDGKDLGNLPAMLQYYSFAGGNGHYVAVGRGIDSQGSTSQTTNFAYATDSTNWVIKSGIGKTNWEQVVFFKNRFFAVGQSFSYFKTSSNGTSWGDVDFDFTGSFENGDVLFVSDTRLAVFSIYQSTHYVAYTENGTSWTQVTCSGLPYGTYCYFAFNKKQNCYLAVSGLSLYRSENGITWQFVGSVYSQGGSLRGFGTGGDYAIFYVAPTSGVERLRKYSFLTNSFSELLEDGYLFSPLFYDEPTDLFVFRESFSYRIGTYDAKTDSLGSFSFSVPSGTIVNNNANNVFVGRVGDKIIAGCSSIRSGMPATTYYGYHPTMLVDTLGTKIEDVSGNDVTSTVVASLNGIQTSTLDNAYREGVNAYIGE